MARWYRQAQRVFHMLVGLVFLLFLSGLDVELGRLRGRLLRLAGLGFVLSLGLALHEHYEKPIIVLAPTLYKMLYFTRTHSLSTCFNVVLAIS